MILPDDKKKSVSTVFPRISMTNPRQVIDWLPLARAGISERACHLHGRILQGSEACISSFQIVWDADKQRWVNVNGDDDDSNQVTAPPPSDFQLHAAPDAPSADPVPAMTAPAANTTFLEQAYQQARQPMAQQQQQQQVAPAQQAMTTQQQGQQQAAISKPSGGLNRYRRNESKFGFAVS